MSSLVFLGFSIILFFVSYGILWTLAPQIFGVFFTLADDIVASGLINAEWSAIYEDLEDRVQWLVPLIPTLGIFVVVIKVLMVASVRGRD